MMSRTTLAGEKNAELARFYQALIQAAGAFVHLQKNFQHPSHSSHSRRLLPPAARLLRVGFAEFGRPAERISRARPCAFS